MVPYGKMIQLQVLAIAACWLAIVPGQPVQGQGYKINLPLPSDPGLGGGDVVQFKVSPDGSHIAYIADQETADVLELFVASTDGSRDSHKLNPPMGERGFVTFYTFTPDSARVVFIADAEVDEQFELYSAPVDGSAPAVRLHGPMVEGGDVGDTYLTHPLLIGGPGPRVVFPADLEQDNHFQLYSAPADGSTPPIVLNELLGPDQDVNNEFLVGSPDGTFALYFSDEETDGLFDLWKVPLDGSATPTKVIQDPAGSQGIGGEGGDVLQFTPDGTEIIFRGDLRTAGSYELFRVPSDGSSPPAPVLAPLPSFADVFNFALTPDGSRILYLADASRDAVIGLWSAPTHGGAPPVKLSGTMVPDGDVDGTGSLDGPFQISPDGTRVVYRADQLANDRYELFSAPVDGSTPTVRLTRIDTHGRTSGYRISPDGRRVVFLAKLGTYSPDELFVVSIRGGSAQRLSRGLVTGGNVQPAFRVGDDFVVFRADARTDEKFELFSAPLVGYPPPLRESSGAGSVVGPKAPTLLNRPLGPQSDVDTGIVLFGDRVFYIADQRTPAQKEAFSSPLNGSEEPLVVSAELTVGPPVGDVDRFGFAGTRMWYAANQDRPQVEELFSVSFDGPPPRAKLHDQGVSGGSARYPQTTPDGSRVVYLSDAHVPYQYELFSVPADGSTPPVELSGTIVPVGGDVFEDFVITPDGSRAIYRGTLEADDVMELYSAPVDGGAPQVKLNPPLTGQRDVEPGVLVSPNSQWVVYLADQDVNDVIHLYSVPSDGSAPPVRLSGAMVPGGDVQGVTITPDSGHVVYSADQAIDDVFEVFAAPIDGSSQAIRLNPTLAGDRDVRMFAVTPDSQRVLYTSDEAVNECYDLYSVLIDGSKPPVRGSQAFLFRDGVISFTVTPDGSRVVYSASKDPNGLDGLFSASLVGGEPPIEIGHPVQSSYDEISLFRLAPDGQRAVYLVRTVAGNELYTAWIDGSRPAVELDELGFATGELAFVADDELVYRARALQSYPMELFHVPLLGDRPSLRLLDPLPSGRDVTGFAVDSSGTRLLYRADQEADERYELFLVFLSPP